MIIVGIIIAVVAGVALYTYIVPKPIPAPTNPAREKVMESIVATYINQE